MTDREYPPMPATSTGMRGKCPRCGQGEIFDGFLSMKSECDVCGLDLTYADTADGPAFFVGFAASVPVLAFALWMALGVEAPVWLTILLTAPLLAITCIAPLRPFKGWLAANQYNHRAAEGRLDDNQNPG